MFSNDENSGVFTFMVGMIVLVMAGVGLSLVVDRRFKFSSGVGQTRRDIASQTAELDELTRRADERGRELETSGTRLHAAARGHRDITASLDAVRKRQMVLEADRSQLRDSVAALEAGFSDYRSDYRRRTWTAAVGEFLGTLTIRSGRQYLQASISRVTDVGLEIRHEDGIARVQAPELDRQFQDRFQWDDEQRRTRLKEEYELLEGKPAGRPEPPTSESRVVTKPESSSATDPAELNRLRQHVIAWKMKVTTLRSEWTDAISRASYGRQGSVPGSLETWAAKSARLGRDLARAQAGLATARSDLSMVAPGDPLLRSEERDRP